MISAHVCSHCQGRNATSYASPRPPLLTQRPAHSGRAVLSNQKENLEEQTKNEKLSSFLLS